MAANFDGSSMKEFILGERKNNWDRRVKRKVEDAYYEVKRASDNSEVEVELLSELGSMKEALDRQQITIDELSSELDEERNAAASAAEEAMTFISRLQKEKAQMHMEASQFRRYAEGKFAHDQQELFSLENLLYRKEQMIKALELEVQSFKHRILSIGGYEYENVNRSPERSRLDEVDDYYYLTESSGGGKNFSVEQDGFDFNDRKTRDSVYRQAKETNSRRICLGKLTDTQNSLQPQLEWEDTYSPRIMQVQEIGSCSSHPSQLDDYNSSSQHALNCRHGLQKSDVHDSKNVEIWEYVERLEERLQQLERETHSEHPNSEWSEMRKLRPKHLSAYSDKLIRRPSADSLNSSDKSVGATEDSSKGEDGLVIVRANGSCSGKKSIHSQVMDDTDEKMSSMSNISKNPNDSSKCTGCKPMKENVGYIGECDSLPQKHEACTATKKGSKIPYETHLPSSRGNPALTQAVDDVPDVKSDDARSGGCEALKGNRDCYGDPGSDSSPQRHIGQPERSPDPNERSEGRRMTAFSVELRTEPDQGPVQSEIKQLIFRIRALEDERQSMKQAIMYFEKENSSCLALLKEIARQHYEVQILDERKNHSTRLSPSEGPSILSIIKWILSYIFRRAVRRCQSKYIRGVSSNGVGLLFLLDNTSYQRIGPFVTRMGSYRISIH
ncbi:uncharacterized protein LOC131065824 [Cryptomeria japonica]|uniref:uncharacterized protein LOC131065824 n=1 Tax=Cryptomeria japonica TaxID=3369 RepID=UPI0027DA951F|nr:uncharacterized protein LOC131065824 [Cryptomeria japonica]XP_057856446.2 uncharacterized protein LOC131065824 [Cryptomeria japonica]